MSNLSASQKHQCPMCYNKACLLYSKLKDRQSVGKKHWTLARCTNPECNHVWLLVTPTGNEKSAAYHEYYTQQKTTCSTNNLPTKNNYIYSLSFRVLKQLLYSLGVLTNRDKHYLYNLPPPSNIKKLLEIGCGNGDRLNQLKSIGWDVMGQEVDPLAAKIAEEKHGIKIHVGQIDSLPCDKETFDYIVMNHVIEHIKDPSRFISEALSYLKSDGKLVAITPNINSLGHKAFRSSWRDLDPPRHLHLYTPKSLLLMINKTIGKTCKIYTSSVNAEIIFQGSWTIKQKGKLYLTLPPTKALLLSSMLWQIVTRIFWIFSPYSGEECIIEVVKK